MCWAATKRIPEDSLQHVGGEVLAGVDALVLLHEHIRRDLHLGVGIVEGGVQHDDGEAQDETGVGLYTQQESNVKGLQTTTATIDLALQGTKRKGGGEVGWSSDSPSKHPAHAD